jgi:hypothetical protein
LQRPRTSCPTSRRTSGRVWRLPSGELRRLHQCASCLQLPCQSRRRAARAARAACTRQVARQVVACSKAWSGAACLPAFRRSERKGALTQLKEAAAFLKLAASDFGDVNRWGSGAGCCAC